MNKVLITSNKEDRLDDLKSLICDPEYNICFEDVTCKKFIEQHLGYVCQMCKTNKNQIRKF